MVVLSGVSATIVSCRLRTGVDITRLGGGGKMSGVSATLASYRWGVFQLAGLVISYERLRVGVVVVIFLLLLLVFGMGDKGKRPLDR